MLYRQMGIHIPRDSKDQVKWSGFNEVPLEAIRPGDLLFFGSSDQKVSHVALYLDQEAFIHATSCENQPYIRISHLKEPKWNGQKDLPYRTACTLK